MDIKSIKKEARKNVKRNYFKKVLIVFLCSLLVYGKVTYTNILDVDLTNKTNIDLINKYDIKTNTEILDELLDKTNKEKKIEEEISKRYTKGVLSLFINELTETKSLIFTLLNGVNKILGGRLSSAVIIFLSTIVLYFIKNFILKPLVVGKKRYFLEENTYNKTKMERVVYPYKKKKMFSISWILFVRDVYLTIWSLTIVGYFIKKYEYMIIEYILAENPNIKLKDAFRISKDMTYGYKWDMFKLDISILLWRLLSVVTFDLLNIFYTNVYRESIYLEVFNRLRKDYKNELLNDKLLYENKDNLSVYPDVWSKFTIKVGERKEYSLISYILFFFTFSFVGWIWEVGLHLINDGVFVNRGTMHGPWIPIYGIGGVLILLLLKKYYNNPFKLFVASFILCGIVEYFFGWVLETFIHMRYWNYSGYFINIKGRVCLEGLIVFGLGGVGFTYIFAPILDNFYKKINDKFKKVLCTILISVFLVDLFISNFVYPNTGKGISSEVKSR